MNAQSRIQMQSAAPAQIKMLHFFQWSATKVKEHTLAAHVYTCSGLQVLTVAYGCLRV